MCIVALGLLTPALGVMPPTPDIKDPMRYEGKNNPNFAKFHTRKPWKVFAESVLVTTWLGAVAGLFRSIVVNPQKQEKGMAVGALVGLSIGASYGAYAAYNYRKVRKATRKRNIYGAAATNDVDSIKKWNQYDKSLVTTRDAHGRTPLMYAAHNGATEGTKALLAIPAVRKNLDLLDCNDESALDHAQANGHTTTAELLRENGAKDLSDHQIPFRIIVTPAE